MIGCNGNRNSRAMVGSDDSGSNSHSSSHSRAGTAHAHGLLLHPMSSKGGLHHVISLHPQHGPQHGVN